MISISKYIRFGFKITYQVWINGLFILDFDEVELSVPYNRKTMDKLIFSELNRKRYYKLNRIKLQTLEEIEY
jgi:hypothetical protein